MSLFGKSDINAEPAEPLRGREALTAGCRERGVGAHAAEVQAADLGLAVLGPLLGGAVDLLVWGRHVHCPRSAEGA